MPPPNPQDPANQLIANAVKMHQQGRFDDARNIYLQILNERPRHFDAHYLLGLACASLGETDTGIHHLKFAISIDPQSAMAHYNLGVVLGGAGRTGESIESFRNSIRLNALFAEAHNNLGNALASNGRLDEAAKSYEQAIKINPQYAHALSNLGNAFRAKGDLDGALSCYQRALTISPNFFDALTNLAGTMVQLRRPADALAAYSRAAALNPANAQLHGDIGNVLAELRRFTEAIASYQKSLDIAPGNANTHYNIGIAYLETGDADRGAAHLQKAIEIWPSHADAMGIVLRKCMQSCKFRELPGIQQQLAKLVEQHDIAIDPFVFIGINDSPAAELMCAKNYTRRTVKSYPALYCGTEDYRHEKIRVAYLSADFHEHATAYLMAELFEIHDRQRFEITGISFGPDDQSPMRQRLRHAFDRFEDVSSVSDLAVARRLHELQVDIAVDLKGYTENARPAILAMRPAPIQVSYLGFPGTTGADFIDYIIGDRFVTPFEQQPCFSEKIVQLPDSYQVNDSKRAISLITPDRKECGLPETGFVFSCFNKNAKILPEIFDVWMGLLKDVEGSVLWLFGENENLRNEAAARGISPHRLVFAQRCSLEQHLARQRLADLFLDTLPCNAHTTASDALWVGLPILTCMGKTFAGRVAASLLNAAGLPELITCSLDDYAALAKKLAYDPKLLESLRVKLIRNRGNCALFDSHRFRAHIEKAFEIMVAKREQGVVPEQFAVPALPSANERTSLST